MKMMIMLKLEKECHKLALELKHLRELEKSPILMFLNRKYNVLVNDEKIEICLDNDKNSISWRNYGLKIYQG